MGNEKKPNFDSSIYVTIITDASYFHETGAAGYAVWMKYGEKSTVTRKAGYFLSKGSNQAEQKALEIGVETAINMDIVKGKVVVIQSDCTGALDNLDLSELRKLAKFVKIKHVKGHQGHATPRNSVNTWCDHKAREQGRKFNNMLKKGID